MFRPHITRFAPSPSGRLHLGHALAAYIASQKAIESGGICYLRIEDIDLHRCRPEYAAHIIEDLNWLGLRFSPDIWIQSTRYTYYQSALDTLKKLGVLYPCFCTRKEIQTEASQINNAPQGSIATKAKHYLGKCKNLSPQEIETRMNTHAPYAWRLNCQKAAKITGPLSWHDERHGSFITHPEKLGDVILARKDCPTSYHIAVVVDDAAQGITLVSRGEDLLEATHIHRLLQELLNFPTPTYYHHSLIRDITGKRLAKRDNASSLNELQQQGLSPQEVLNKILPFF